MTRAEALNKVKKLLRLGKSSNANEAATALRMAQALMRQHALDESEANEPEDEVAEESTEHMRGKAPAPYASQLLWGVAHAFGVEPFFTTFLNKHTAGFFGPKSRGQIAAYAYAVLLRQLERDRRLHLSRVRVRKNRAARGDAFGIGWVQGVAAVLPQWEISLREKGQIEAFRARKYPNMKRADFKPRQSKAVSDNDYFRGKEDGRKAQFNHGVAGSKQRAIEGPR